jgi:error-prone DNA polymerase
MAFLLLEDEFGTFNIVITPPVYERFRLLIRTEPLLLIEGRLEKPRAGGGAININASEIKSIDLSLGAGKLIELKQPAQQDRSHPGQTIPLHPAAKARAG